MTGGRANDEELLARLAAGEIDESDPGVAARLARDAGLAREWESLRDARDQIDRAAREERETLAEARREWERRPPPSLSLPITPRRAAAPAASRARWWIAAAASIALVAGFAIWRSSRGDSDRGSLRTTLGPGAARCIAPEGAVSSWGGFEARATIPTGGWCTIAVRAEGSSADLLTSPRLSSPAWKPSPADLARLPERIEWRADVFDASGSPVSSCSSRAWLLR